MPFSHFRQRYTWLIVAGCYGIGFLVMLRIAYIGALPNWFSSIPNYDKPLHVLLYAIATYLGHRLFCGKRWRIKVFKLSWALPLFPIAFAIFTTIEELAQGFSPNRSLDALDLICSLVGCWIGYGLAERGLAKERAKLQHKSPN